METIIDFFIWIGLLVAILGFVLGTLLIKEAMKKSTATNILSWLKSSKGNWYQHTDNPNCFTDKENGRALYLYKSHVTYWEDIRAGSVYSKFPIPKSQKELFEIIKK